MRAQRKGFEARDLKNPASQRKQYITPDPKQPWVQQALAQGHDVIVVRIPWYFRLWWKIKRLLGRTDDITAQRLLAERVKEAFPPIKKTDDTPDETSETSEKTDGA